MTSLDTEMPKARKIDLLMYPWSECEMVISEIGKRNQRTLRHSYTLKKWENLSEFLKKNKIYRYRRIGKY